MLGVPYGPKWPEDDEEGRKRILRAFGDMGVGIASFGSTVLPGLRLRASREDPVWEDTRHGD
jgi:GrpB-like predicted nucleotidyltransferase (UPF0157 family)